LKGTKPRKSSDKEKELKMVKENYNDGLMFTDICISRYNLSWV